MRSTGNNVKFLPHQPNFNPDRTVRVDSRDQPGLWMPGQTHTWDHATFTVPDSVSDEKVTSRIVADKYNYKYAKELWKQGFEILEMEGPYIDKRLVAAGMTDDDRRPYIIRAKIRRAPQEVRVDVPDEDVPIYLAAGYKLA
jgi:hypothetical protein